MPHPDDLVDAARAHNNDIDALAELDDDQLDYLARAHQIPDPLTDGLECDNEERG